MKANFMNKLVDFSNKYNPLDYSDLSAQFLAGEILVCCLSPEFFFVAIFFTIIGATAWAMAENAKQKIQFLSEVLEKAE